MRGNPAHDYRKLAKEIVAKMKLAMVETIELGRAPDLHWKLESAVMEALKFADQCGSDRTREQLMDMMAEFDDEDGTTSN